MVLGEDIQGIILMLLLIGNIFGVFSSLWSVCVEFQFYLISPAIVQKMLKSSKPWLIVLALCLISIGLNLGMYIFYDPKSLHKNIAELVMTEDVYFFWNYS